MKRKNPYKQKGPVNVLGMLHIVEVRLVNKKTNEKIKHKLLVVGCEAADIERKVKWIFDYSKYDQFSITNVEKVRQKIHILNTVITEEKEVTSPIIKRNENTQIVHQQETHNDKSHLYAVGITTTMIGINEDHAIRKIGKALLTRGKTEIKTTQKLSEDSKIIIEEISFKDGTALPRDVTQESEKAHFVRG